MVVEQRSGVFVSYAKEDSRTAAQLMSKLVPIARDGVVRVFWDEEIKPGRDWHKEIVEALATTRVGMLLVSDAFLGSRYITDVELPFLVEEASAGRIELFWFLLTKSLYKETCLASLQAAHDVEKPLIQLDKAGIDEVFGEAAQKVADLLFAGEDAGVPVVRDRIPLAKDVIQPEHRYSTGAAVSEIAGDLIKAVQDGSVRSIDAAVRLTGERAESLRGKMIPFCHFFKLGRHYPVVAWPDDSSVIISYLGQWNDFITVCNERVGQEFADYIGKAGGSFAMAEYSRAVLSGLRIAAGTNQDAFRIITGIRPTAEVVEEPEAFAHRLKKEGWSDVEELGSYEAWIDLLKHAAEARTPSGSTGEHIHMVLFGAEGITSDGGVVFPQRLLDIEIDWLKRMRGVKGTLVVCVAEAYKIMPPEVNDKLEALQREGRYTIVPPHVFDALVTDEGVLYPQPDGTFDTSLLRASVFEKSRQIMESLTLGQQLLPLAQAPDRVLADTGVIVADIDDTLTVAGQLPADVARSLQDLASCGIDVLLITGRSAGWGQALARYLPGTIGVVAENGLVLCRPDESIVRLRPATEDLDLQTLASTASRLTTLFDLIPTADDPFRLYEHTFLRPGSYPASADQYEAVLEADQELLASSIHLHLRHRGWDKSSGLVAALEHLAPAGRRGILVVGDSANDRSLFREYPERSIGVANVIEYAAELGVDQPRWVTAAREGRGFVEIAERMLAAHAH